VVLDPFAGFGTTPWVATRMGRRAVAVELLDERAAFIRQRLHGGAEIITGDARQLGSLVGGPVDLCLTSPPYMTANGHPQNPLTGYMTADGDYHTYPAEPGRLPAER
jgi:DNA modification methylase